MLEELVKYRNIQKNEEKILELVRGFRHLSCSEILTDSFLALTENMRTLDLLVTIIAFSIKQKESS